MDRENKIDVLKKLAQLLEDNIDQTFFLCHNMAVEYAVGVNSVLIIPTEGIFPEIYNHPSFQKMDHTHSSAWWRYPLIRSNYSFTEVNEQKLKYLNLLIKHYESNI